MMSWRGLGRAAAVSTRVLGARARLAVSYLPLCHVAEQMFSIHIPLPCGAVVNFAESLRTVQEDLRELSPQIFFGVPRIWEKFHASIQTKCARRRLALWTLPARDGVAGERRRPRARSWSAIERLRWAFWYVLILRALLNYRRPATLPRGDLVRARRSHPRSCNFFRSSACRSARPTG
jgi:long-chain acyl-CoA synthetase